MTKTATKEAISVCRTSAGLREALFDELDALRRGESNPTRTNAVAKISASVVETVRMEIEVQKFAAQTVGKATADAPSPIKSLTLGN